MKARVKYYEDYNGEEGFAVEICIERVSFDDWENKCWKVTHWMPLPEMP